MLLSPAEYFHLADRILVLGNSGIFAQGEWSNIKATNGNIVDSIVEQPKAGIADEYHQIAAINISEQMVEDRQADVTRKTGDITIYAYYLRSIGAKNCSMLVLGCSAYAFAVIFPQYWLKWWTEANGTNMWFYVVGFALLSFTAWLSTSMITWLTYIKISPRSGGSFHSGLLRTIFGAQLSYFFVADTGTILNRFGQDIQMVDRDIPDTLAGLGVQIFRMIMQAALLLSVQRQLALILPIYMAIVYVLQKFYLQTSRQLRLLELESRAAVYSSFLETVDGLATIRAMGWQDDYSEHNDHCLDEFQRPTYLLLCLQRWLNVVLNLMVAGIAVVVIAITVLSQKSNSGAEIGISLNIILVTNTTLLRLVQFWTTLEISLGAVARLKKLESETPQEHDVVETIEPDAAWPKDGCCELCDLQVSYDSRAISLRNINLSIRGGQKVLICGKTGRQESLTHGLGHTHTDIDR
ncbi:Hypothetical protein R9X50_00607300 [Acrodontium crateriforme]|uniref:ABC transmembrane type-1 domain-containing protein n=1 Tax=Acrodontium crateriforme TaxID=150365 RepID=A0AAQ3MD13_9PEZI|nr:Hypothetical protein R9X50_00607300 [Acrodontium crateriforme]